MKGLLYVFHLVILLLMGMATGVAQSHFVLQNGSSLTYDGYLNPVGTIADDGDSTAAYSNSFWGEVTITASPGDTILLSGEYNVEGCCDMLRVYSCFDDTCLLGTWSGTGSLSTFSTSGQLTVEFSTDGSVVYNGFLLHYEVHSTNCSVPIGVLSASELSPTSVELHWTTMSPSALFVLNYGSVDTLVTGTTATVEGLTPNSDYTFTIVAEDDTAETLCDKSLTVHTPRFLARVEGLRPLCGMDTLRLTADTADGWWWSTGETTRTVEVTDTGWYELVALTGSTLTDTMRFRVGTIELDIETHLPAALCPGDSVLVTVGLAEGSTVQVIRGESTLSESARIFLPDGQYCEPNGCSYRSELEFSGFESNAHISDVNDIRYVMLNIEHSYMGDIYINITCPNHQSADILRFCGSGTSSCTEHIGSDSRGWQSGSNLSTGTYLGLPVDYEDNSYPCDSTRYDNRPGTGWRYCWSNCTDAGFTYAGGDGLIYRASNYNSANYTADSSDVAAGTHFYHPDNSFSNLIGCPMNGTWYIEVIDGWGVDNGYIFGWELALNPDRLSRTDYVPTVAYADVDGEYVSRRSDTSFMVTAPLQRSTDTTVTYTVLITDSLGCVFDTSITVQLLASSSSEVSDTVNQNELPVTYNGQTFNSEVADVAFHYPNSSGCDSLVLYSLYVRHNSYATFDTSLCASQLPLQWYHRTFYGAGTQDDTIVNHLGADSILTLTLHVLPTVQVDIDDTICSNQTATFEGTAYSTAGDYAHTFTTSLGCDSVRTLHLAVLPTQQSDTFATACDHFAWHDSVYTQSTTNAQFTTLNSAGCDSTVTLHLTLYSSYSTVRLDTLCAGDSIDFGGSHYSAAGFYSHTFASQQGCDSVVLMHLDVSPTTYGDYYDTCLENQLPHSFMGITAWDDTTAALTLANSRGCDSVLTYHLHVLRNSYATFDTSMCADYFPLQWFHRIFYGGGTQYDTLVNHLGADSILTLNMGVRPTYYDTVDATICSGSAYIFEGDTLTTAGYHSHTYTSSQGCDSVVALHLVVLPTHQSDTFATACDQFAWHDSVYTQSTPNAQFSTLNSAGCDSTVTLHLTLNYSTDTNIVAEACDSYNWFGTNYLVPPASVPVHVIPNAAGCDSIMRLAQLTIHPTQHIYDFDTACSDDLSGGYHWRDTILYGLSGSTSVMLYRTDRYGCDSLLHLSLTVFNDISVAVNDTIVENQAATWQYNGVPLASDTVVQFLLTNRWGCDSVVTYRLHVWRNVYDTVDTTICYNMLATFGWNGLTSHLTQGSSAVMTDTLVATLVGSHGVDSIVTLHMLVNPTYQHILYDTICDNLPYTFAGQTINTSGQYAHTFLSRQGCDSVVTLHLTVHPTYSQHRYDTIYVGDTIFFEGNGYVQPGDYPTLLYTADGCDSLITLHLEGRNLLYAERTDSLCEGDTFYFCGRPLTEAGVYADTIYSGDFFAGDTVVTLTLVVVQRPEATIVATPYCDPPAHYTLLAVTEARYLRWEGPTVVEGLDRDSLIAVLSPADTSLYRLYADYRAEQFCPAVVDTMLPPVPVLHALIDVRPTAITIDERHLTATQSNSGAYTSHLWYVFYNEDAPFTDTARRLQLDVPMYVDSLNIVLSIANYACTASDTVHVDVLRADILFPNVFTPSDGTNNLFHAYTTAVSDFELWIYDRRGALVFHSTDINQGWDGTHDGKPLPQAAYVYKCRYRDQLTPSGYQNVTGTVTLLR